MAELRSPIVRLLNQIAASPYRIAPEREAELGRIVEELGLTISIGEGKSFDFWVGTESKEITTNIATLEFLWASAHAHVVLFDEYGKAQKDGDRQFDTGKNKRCKKNIGVKYHIDSYGITTYPLVLAVRHSIRPMPSLFPIFRAWRIFL